MLDVHHLQDRSMTNTAALTRTWWPSYDEFVLIGPVQSRSQPARQPVCHSSEQGPASPIVQSTSVATTAQPSDRQGERQKGFASCQADAAQKVSPQPATAQQQKQSTQTRPAPPRDYDSPPERPRTPVRAGGPATCFRAGPGPYGSWQGDSLDSPCMDKLQSGTKHPTAGADASTPRVTHTRKPAAPSSGQKQAGTVLYAAVFLSPDSRKELLQRSPPKYKKRSANHMTLAFQPSTAILSGLPLGEHAQLTVLSFASDAACQALMVEPPDMLADFAPRAAHITVSVTVETENREAGALVSRIVEDEQQQQAHFQPCTCPWTLTGRVGVRMSDGRALFSRAELERDMQLCRVLDDLETALQPGRQQHSQQAQTVAAMPPSSQQDITSSNHDAAQQCAQYGSHSAPGNVAAHAGSSPPSVLTAWQQQPGESKASVGSTFAAGGAQVPGSLADEGSDNAQQPQHRMRRRPRRCSPPASHTASAQIIPQHQAESMQRGTQPSPLQAGRQGAACGQDSTDGQQGVLGLSTSPVVRGWWDELQGLPDSRWQGRREARRGRCWTAEREAGVQQSQLEAAAEVHAGAASSQPDGSLLLAWTQHCGSAPPTPAAQAPAASSAVSHSPLTPEARASRRFAASQPVPIRQAGPVARSHPKWQSSGGSSGSDTEQAGHQHPSTGSSEGSPLMHGQAPALDQAAARDMAKAAVARRDATSRLADQERRLADMHATSAGVFQRAAKDAFDQGETAVGKELSGRSKEHLALAADARVRANADAYDAHNAGITNRFKIDLHGLNVDEAMAMLDRHLANLGGLSAPGGILLQVVTGVGKHSAGGQPRILPAVVRSLRESGLQFWSQPDNAGMVEVLLPASRHSPYTSGP